MVLVCIHLNAGSDNVDHYSLLNILFGVIMGSRYFSIYPFNKVVGMVSSSYIFVLV